MESKQFFLAISIITGSVVVCIANAQQQAVEAVRLDDIADDPDAFIGKTIQTSVWLNSAFIDKHKETSIEGRILFDGYLVGAKDGTRPAATADKVGNAFMLQRNALNPVIMKKEMARGLKDALQPNRDTRFDATVTVERLPGSPARLMILRVLQTTLSDGRTVTIHEKDFDK